MSPKDQSQSATGTPTTAAEISSDQISAASDVVGPETPGDTSRWTVGGVEPSASPNGWIERGDTEPGAEANPASGTSEAGGAGATGTDSGMDSGPTTRGAFGPESAAARTVLAAVLVTAVLAGCAAAHDSRVLIAGVAVVQVALMLGWVLGTAMPGRIGALVIAAAGFAAADASVAAWPTSELSPLLAPFGLAILAMFIHQLTRGVVRARVVESLSGIAVVLASGIALTALVQLHHEFAGRTMAVGAGLAAGSAVIAALVVDLLWSRPRFDPVVPRGLAGVVVGTIVGAVLGRLAVGDGTGLDAGQILLVTSVTALLATLASVGTSFISYGLATQDIEPVSEFAVIHTPRPELRPLPEGILPIALVAPVAYVLFLSIS